MKEEKNKWWQDILIMIPWGFIFGFVVARRKRFCYFTNKKTKGCKMNHTRFRFRIWDNEIKEYLIGCFLVGGEMIHNAVDHESFLDTGNFVIEQCTGLKDKNGNLIYEGDIVKCDRDFCGEGRVGLIRTVVFSDGAFQIQKINKEDRYYINAFHNFEVLGNIHEQAEQKD